MSQSSQPDQIQRRPRYPIEHVDLGLWCFLCRRRTTGRGTSPDFSNQPGSQLIRDGLEDGEEVSDVAGGEEGLEGFAELFVDWPCYRYRRLRTFWSM